MAMPFILYVQTGNCVPCVHSDDQQALVCPGVKQLTAPSPHRLEHLGLVSCHICSRGSAENNKVNIVT